MAEKTQPSDDRECVRWKCRRGMLELDKLLNCYFEAHYDALSDTEKQIFNELLEQSDQDLWWWFMGRTQPEDLQLNQLVQTIRDYYRESNNV